MTVTDVTVIRKVFDRCHESGMTALVLSARVE